jgi:hypothetical protein
MTAVVHDLAEELEEGLHARPLEQAGLVHLAGSFLLIGRRYAVCKAYTSLLTRKPDARVNNE